MEKQRNEKNVHPNEQESPSPMQTQPRSAPSRIKKASNETRKDKEEPQKSRFLDGRQKKADGFPFPRELLAKHTFTAPLLCAAVFLLLLITSSISLPASSATESYLVLSSIQIFVFMLPSVFYIRFRSLDIREQVRFRLPHPDKLMFCVLCALLLIVASVLFSFLGASEQKSVYNLPEGSGGSGAEAVYLAVCFALIPAVCEEFLVRGIIMYEYQASGIFSAVTVSSLVFSMLHFDMSNFPFCFFAGLVFSLCTYASGSIIASMAVHLLYNLFSLFGGEIVRITVNSISDTTLITVCLAVLLLLLLTLTFGECQRIYAAKAKKNLPSPPKLSGGAEAAALRFAEALFSPVMLVCIVIFFIASLL
jgi:membrane protease YdiL (CAAX protease family)